MLVSRNWLQKFFDVELPSAEALAEALTFHAFEIDGIEKKGNDNVLDVKVTPNRGHDCLSHRGIAKELSAILKIPLTHDPLDGVPTLAPVTNAVSVKLEEEVLSPRYIASYIKGVKVGSSPEWLKVSLETLGQRSVNNIVDATNYIMLDTGQPLHAFDAGELAQKDGKYLILVRKAKPNETITTLDDKTYMLNDSILVIADDNKNEAIGIAGVKGGKPAGITEATADIVIESANFNGVSVRKTASALKLRTDASSRFEQGLSPELAGYGMRSVVDLILKIAGGELVGFVDVYPAAKKEGRVSVSIEKINTLLGSALTGADVADVFVRLGFEYKEEGGMFEVLVPFERLDITIPEDLVEEVGRIVGYDKIAAVPLSPLSSSPAVNSTYCGSEKVREELLAKGYSEVYTSVFADQGERAVLNKVDSVRPFLRASLTEGLTEALKKNIPNKDLLGLTEIKLFEIGTVWSGGKEVVMIGTVSEKEKASEKELEAKEADHYETLPLSTTTQYQPFSKYPYIVRDIAIWVPNGIEHIEVLKIITKEAGELLMRSQLFDQFEKAGRTSYAFRLVFQSFERTLTETEVGVIMEKIYASLKEKGFEIR
ncbi:MAG: Phenylalanine-tRNA ligase beta subunit [Parcubacteria group bacterium Gr01-1014_56]|nr:MAG: Phenylalanine-tRNA ligase beta subunit [Parcubacteria group bacterium Gr01-1014_56]